MYNRIGNILIIMNEIKTFLSSRFDVNDMSKANKNLGLTKI